ncbi:hypothetical protein A2U01_0028198, partial [Trifolium medium]|nr:hypothetical protein [Trifolium medium]
TDPDTSTPNPLQTSPSPSVTDSLDDTSDSPPIVNNDTHSTPTPDNTIPDQPSSNTELGVFMVHELH